MSLSRKDVNTFLRDSVSEVIGQATLPENTDLLKSSLIDDLEMDSLDFINLMFRIEEKYGLSIPEEDIDKHELIRFGSLLEYVVANG